MNGRESLEGGAAGAGDDGKRSVAQRPFLGTDHPRELRALHALMRRPMPREHIDREAGCSNGPDLIGRLRDRGLDLPCPRVPVIDRDGRECMRGVYFLTTRDRRCIALWLFRRDAERAQAKGHQASKRRKRGAGSEGAE